ncbi:hypothetical protein ACBJ59_00595 [Nonomuraea sp. MTCD27]|uniref:hypothetical protein n=1 Tax=Nonomuraea sp. MTCD27 TaxID=1676747 RepID=UPI0035C205F7
MTRLREALGDLATEAPLVHLADVAIAGHRRRRRATVALASVATVAVLCAASAAVALPWRWAADRATPQQDAATLPDLPGGGVGALDHAYQTPCRVDREARTIDCDDVEWRVVTAAGRTYRVPQALARTGQETVPVAISRDGRLLAYYSRDAQAHVVRDLVTGAEVTSPVRVPEERISTSSMLAVSDDGRHLLFDPREGSKEPALLIDTRTGGTMPVDGRYEVVGIKGGVVQLVRYIKTDLWLMPITGGGKPVRFDGVFINFSEVAPDGRTVAAFDTKDRGKPRLTLLDARTGRTLRKVAVHGMPADQGPVDSSVWRSGSEVSVEYLGRKGRSRYGVDVTTGKARLLARYGTRITRLTLPGAVSQPGD